MLETAAGSGVVTRALAPILSPDARYVVTDLNQPMLDYAAARQGRDDRISWRKADAQALPFEDAAFDLVCCQFGVMFFPDRPSAYREARRVLKPGGAFLFNAWDRIEENVFADDVTNALAGVFPRRSAALHGAHAARLSRRGTDPQRSGEGRLLERDDRNQGGAKPRALAPSCRVAYCQGTPLRNEIEARGPDKLEAATDHAAAAIARKHGSGEVAAKIQAHVILARA